jgi:hypothetical protein
MAILESGADLGGRASTILSPRLQFRQLRGCISASCLRRRRSYSVVVELGGWTST